MIFPKLHFCGFHLVEQGRSFQNMEEYGYVVLLLINQQLVE